MCTNKIRNYVEGIKEYLEHSKIINLESCEDDGIEFDNILEELDRQNINYQTGDYWDEYGNLKTLQPMAIYCDQFYIEE